MTAGARAHNAWRRAGYRLLPGDSFSYLLHMRPAEWPIMAAHTALGFVLAVGLGPASHGAQLGTGLWAIAIWVLLLNGGTLAINSVFDRDEGDIGYLDAPPAPPRHLFGFAVALLLAGQAAAYSLPRGFVLAYAVCLVLSVAYSVPPLRFKAVGGVDWLINMIGFGTLTPYAGWAATGRPLDTAATVVLWAFCPLFAALYPLTQIYQFEEDRRRGDRTLALMLGVRWSLVVALVAALAAFAMLFWAAAAAGTAPWQRLALGVALGAWLWVLVPWYVRRDTMPQAAEKRGMYAALAAWAVTDVAVLAAFAVPA